MVFLLYPSSAFGLRQRPLFFDWFRPSLDKPISGAVQFRYHPKDTNEYLEKKGVKKSVNIGNWWNTFIHLNESQSNWKKKAMAIWPLKWKGQWSGKFEILLLPKWEPEPRCCWSKEREDWVPRTYFRTLLYFNTLFVISLLRGKLQFPKRKKFVFFIKMASFQKLIIQEERANALLAQEEHFVKTSKFWKSNSSFKFCNVRAILNCLPTSFPKSFFWYYKMH